MYNPKEKSDQKKYTLVHLQLYGTEICMKTPSQQDLLYNIKSKNTNLPVFRKIIFIYLQFQLRNRNPDEDCPDLTIRVIDSGFLITFDLLGYKGPLSVVHAPIVVREQVILCLIIKVLDAHFENHPIPGRRISCFPRLRR